MTTTGFNPFKLRVNGQVYENGNGESAKDRLFRALAEKHEAKAAMILAKDDDEEGTAPAPQENISTAGKFLKDVGVDVDKMQDRAEKERDKLEARAERAELARIAAETADRSGGLNPLALDLARRAIEERENRPEDPITTAVKEVYARKITQDLSGERPSAIQEIASSLDGLTSLMEVAKRLSPPAPAAVVVGMSPEKAFELEIKKLDIHLELEKYRADRDAQVAEKKANAWKEIADVLRQAAESIGHSVGQAVVAQMGTTAAQPAATRQAPARQTVENTAEVATCPDCGVDAIMLTQSMIERVSAGGEVQATCTNCGEAHTVSAAQPAPTSPPAAEPPAPSARQAAPPPAPSARLPHSAAPIPRKFMHT